MRVRSYEGGGLEPDDGRSDIAQHGCEEDGTTAVAIGQLADVRGDEVLTETATKPGAPAIQ
jgi:hypothetical protein